MKARFSVVAWELSREGVDVEAAPVFWRLAADRQCEDKVIISQYVSRAIFHQPVSTRVVLPSLPIHTYIHT
jgi:hypothetical protein